MIQHGAVTGLTTGSFLHLDGHDDAEAALCDAPILEGHRITEDLAFADQLEGFFGKVSALFSLDGGLDISHLRKRWGVGGKALEGGI